MDSNSLPKKLLPVEQASPEEDAKLLAIEALEARAVDLNPEPLNPPPVAVVVPPAVVAPLLPPAPITPVQVIEPIVAPITVEKPQKPATPAEEMAEALAHASAPSRFQFFLHQKPPRKPFIILIVVVVIIGIATVAYFAIR